MTELERAYYERKAGLRLGHNRLAKEAKVGPAAAKKFLARQELAQIYKRPQKQKAQAHINVSAPNIVHHADLLYLPHDGNKKYALVVVDAHTRKVDAEPLKDRTAAAVRAGFETIYGRHTAGTALSTQNDTPTKEADT